MSPKIIVNRTHGFKEKITNLKKNINYVNWGIYAREICIFNEAYHEMKKHVVHYICAKFGDFISSGTISILIRILYGIHWLLGWYFEFWQLREKHQGETWGLLICYS